MHPQPDEPEVVDRMRTAHRRARLALDTQPAPDADEAWGWRGRTLGQPVTAPEGTAWLRLACTPAGQLDHTLWDGSIQAATAIPETVPRPRLRASDDWHEGPWQYRAELYDHVDTPPVARSLTLTTPPDLPPSWWRALRAALNAIAAVRTRRYTTQQRYLDWAMPTFLGAPIDTKAPSWTTAHGDLHWANLCAPQLTMLDWEGWGMAPTGYDAALLHSYSLLIPAVAERVHKEFSDVLDTSAGRFAELTAITELLHSTTCGDNLALAEFLRERASHLLGRGLPQPGHAEHTNTA